MTCPDFDQLEELAQGAAVMPEVREHVRSCAVCSDVLLLIRESPAALRPDLVVPEELIQSVLRDVCGRETELNRAVPWRQVVTSGVLGALTAVAVLVATSSLHGSTLLELATAATLIGVAAAFSLARSEVRMRLPL